MSMELAVRALSLAAAFIIAFIRDGIIKSQHSAREYKYARARLLPSLSLFSTEFDRLRLPSDARRCPFS